MMSALDKIHFHGRDKETGYSGGSGDESTTLNSPKSAAYLGLASLAQKRNNQANSSENDVFGNEENATIKYKTLSWQLCAVYAFLLLPRWLLGSG
jgi:hypothetical protein